MFRVIKQYRYLLAISFIFYFISAFNIFGIKLFIPTKLAYYNQLIDAFMSFHLDIKPINTYDITFYNNKWYLYWGPSPVLLIGMFKMLTIESDRLYTLIIGVLNIIVYCFLLEEINKYFKLKLTNFSKYSLVIFFGLLTPNYYLSLSGRIWHTNQIVSIFYLLAGLLLLFMYLNKKRVIYFIAAVILFNLAWLARITLISYLLLIIYIVLFRHSEVKRNNVPDYRISIIINFTIITTVSILLFFTYNFFRFGNIFETGVSHQMANQRYRIQQLEGNMFSIKYVNNNIKYYFINLPTIQLKYPFIKIDPEGNSIFFTSPFFILLIFNIKSLLSKIKQLPILKPFILVIIINTLFLMLFFATGYAQWGSRYYLDIMPIFLILFALD